MKKAGNIFERCVMKMTLLLFLILFANKCVYSQNFESIFINGFEKNHLLIKEKYKFDSFSSLDGTIGVNYVINLLSNDYCADYPFNETFEVEYFFKDNVNSINIQTIQKDKVLEIEKYCKSKCKKVSEEKHSEGIICVYSNSFYKIKINSLNVGWSCNVTNEIFLIDLYLIKIERN